MQAGPFVMMLGLLMALIAGWGFFAARKNRERALASASWPHVTGIVTGHRISREQRTRRVNDNDTYYWVYDPQIWYDYTVNGTAYTGQRISFGQQPEGSEKMAQKVLEQYPVGSAVQVFYDPADPMSPTLSTSAKGTMTTIVLAAIVSTAGVIAFVVGLAIWLNAR
jgi:hypothetical protein